jgi:hypothetical protein
MVAAGYWETRHFYIDVGVCPMRGGYDGLEG